MRYDDDEAHRMVVRMRELVREATEQLSGGSTHAPCAAADEAIVVATGLDPAVVPRLSAEALATVMVMHDQDERVLELLAQALEIEALISTRAGDISKASLRMEQAQAMRGLLDPERAN